MTMIVVEDYKAQKSFSFFLIYYAFIYSIMVTSQILGPQGFWNDTLDVIESILTYS